MAAIPDRGVERLDFHVLIAVTGGHYEHMVDFERHRCGAGSILVVRPGQVHEFGPATSWRGWTVLFRAEDVALHDERPGADPLVPALASLPTHGRLARDALAGAEECLRRMAADGATRRDPRAVTDLLLAQVRVLVLRLSLALAPVAPGAASDPRTLARYHAFRAAVDAEHRRWHQVQDYARHLGCSAKSLNRASRAIVDLSAKQVVTQRIVLEAKRLLAHTTLTVATVGARLGYDDPANFVKVFRRETGTTPGRFRDDHAGR